MQRITAESNIEDIMKTIGIGPNEKLRESRRRETHLEKFAQLRSRNPNTSLTLNEAPTAYVKVEEGEISEFRNITIPTQRFEQSVTDFPQKYHDFLMQKGFTIHETAHILYSSWPALKRYIEKVKEESKDDGEVNAMMFKNFVNALEDGAIEKFASLDFRVDEELYHVRQTLHENTYMGRKKKDEEEWHYPFFFAVMTAVINLGVYDNGELEKLLDKDNEQHKIAFRGGKLNRKMLVELLPKIRRGIDEIQSERDAEERMRLCYELWKEVEKYIQRSTTPGKTETQQTMQSRESDSYMPGIPENISDAHGEQEREASRISSDSDTGGADNGTLLAEEREAEMEQGKIEQKGEEGVVQEGESEMNDWQDELEEIINSLGAGDGVDEIYIPDDGKVDTPRKKEAERYGKRCAKIFRTRLRRKQRDKTITGKRYGEFDSRNMINADRGSARVFKQIREGDQKNYSCMIVCDRSGSMSGRIEEVELAAGAVAYGLEEVGVDTSILDTYSSKTAIAKPFQTDIDSFKRKLLTGRVGGGTPLRYTLQFARQRMERGENDIPFMVVITDGKPSNVGKCKEEIKKANFPVIGLYLTDDDKEEQLKLYNRAVTVSSDEEVTNRLINLINSIVW